MKSVIRNLLCVFLGLLFCSVAGGAVSSQNTAVEQALGWMSGNPVMSQIDANVESVQVFPEGGEYCVYVVEFAPIGYLILNSDDRLPLVLSFSSDSSIDLSDDPQNALRPMLLEYCARTAVELRDMPERLLQVSPKVISVVTELYGPFLNTSWNQNDPYNLFCPGDPLGSAYYGYRVPTGCVPTAFAQILYFHRWPCYGEGSHSYTDSFGSLQGGHSAGFSDEYDWDSMQASHSSSDSQESQNAVAELMIELGVVAEADYESSGTGSSVYTLGSRLDDYLFYESVEYHSSATSLIGPMESELRAGFPCVVAIPGHAVVADGLMVDSGVTTYHINYGWGGSNNGWYTAGGIPGGAIEYGATGIRPQLIAFPETNAISGQAGGSAEIRWILPKRRESEVEQLEVFRYNELLDEWETFAVDTDLESRRFSSVTSSWDDCSNFVEFELTSTATYKDWVVSTTSGVATCFYKQPGGYNNQEYHLTSASTVTPSESTRLLLHAKYNLYADPFSVSVSTDGSTFAEIWSAVGSRDWGDIAIDLSGYAGQGVYVRLEYSSGGYYSGGGVWVDSIRTQEVTHPELEGQPVHYTTLTNLPMGTHRLAAVLTATNTVAFSMGPECTLTVSGGADDLDGDGLPNDWEQLYYGDDTVADPSAMAANGVNSVMDAYIAGLDPTDPDAVFAASLPIAAGDVVQWGAVSGRVYSVYGTTNLTKGFQLLEADMVWPQSSWTDTVSRVRYFYQVDVQLAE